MARVVFSRTSRAQISELAAGIAEAILDALTVLGGEPESGKRLRGHFAGLWSLRIGSYRLIYEVRDKGKTVRVVAVLHRKIAYRPDPS